jgi:hypothetical protein
VLLLVLNIACNLFTLEPPHADFSRLPSGPMWDAKMRDSGHEPEIFQWLLPAYVWEISRPYPTATSRVVAFLRRAARFDDTVATCPKYMATPLIFYIGDKVRMCCEITHDAKEPASLVEARDPVLYFEDNYPKWYVAYGYSRLAVLSIRFFSRPHLSQSGIPIAYNYRLVDVEPVYFFQTQRPEPYQHSFGPPEQLDANTEEVYIFERFP